MPLTPALVRGQLCKYLEKCIKLYIYGLCTLYICAIYRSMKLLSCCRKIHPSGTGQAGMSLWAEGTAQNTSQKWEVENNSACNIGVTVFCINKLPQNLGLKNNDIYLLITLSWQFGLLGSAR